MRRGLPIRVWAGRQHPFSITADRSSTCPSTAAARIAVETVRATRTAVEEVTFVLLDGPAYEAFAAQLRRLPLSRGRVRLG
ncbi:hypothetical protein [Streptomyces mirabilis]|uniref:hypothetical protein n=1 Tax=Streptomyces mirabilis TaxID=68239 RepID=UPI0033AA3BCA